MTSPQAAFGTRLSQAFERDGQVCVGIDPHPNLLAAWGLGPDAAGLTEFGLRVIEAAAGRAAAVKPQVAFFESYGPAGMAALAELIAAAKASGLLVIADAKRGDIGSTMAAYAEAWLNPDQPFGVDALTVSPFLGFGSLEPAVQAAHRYRAGLFVLALTSNPEGQQVQLAIQQQGAGAAEADPTVAAQIIAQAQRANAGAPEVDTGDGPGPLGSIGLVIGATTASLAAAHQLDLTTGQPPLLAPGYGAQGATAAQMRSSFGAAWPQVLVNSSRGILHYGPDVDDLAQAIESARADLR